MSNSDDYGYFFLSTLRCAHGEVVLSLSNFFLTANLFMEDGLVGPFEYYTLEESILR